MHTKSLLLIFAVLAVSAGPERESTVRAALAQLDSGENEAALHSLEAAAKTADDPGIVAFHRGIALARLGRFHEAEVQFVRCLDDSQIPAGRRGKALYNRGVCLLEQGDLASVRQAIDSFAACREVATDELLLTDVRHNLEVAKMKWASLKTAEKTPPTPNEGGEELSKGSDSASGSYGNQSTKGQPSTKPAAGDANAKKADVPRAPGAGTLPVLKDDAVLTPLSPEETQAYLDALAERLKRQRASVERLRAGPERPGVKDW